MQRKYTNDPKDYTAHNSNFDYKETQIDLLSIVEPTSNLTLQSTALLNTQIAICKLIQTVDPTKEEQYRTITTTMKMTPMNTTQTKNEIIKLLAIEGNFSEIKDKYGAANMLKARAWSSTQTCAQTPAELVTATHQVSDLSSGGSLSVAPTGVATGRIISN